MKATLIGPSDSCSVFDKPKNIMQLTHCKHDWAIFCTLGNFLMPLATINLAKSPTFLGNFCKVVKIYHICSGIIFGQLLWTFGNFFWSHCIHVCWANLVVLLLLLKSFVIRHIHFCYDDFHYNTG